MIPQLIAAAIIMIIGWAVATSVSRAVQRTLYHEERTEDIACLYVTDAQQRLVGIVSLRDLIFRRAERRMSEIMNRDVKFVRDSADQEELARQSEHYHYLGLPVLDAEGTLVGVVKASDALEIASDEATEDMQLMVGLSGEEHALTPWPHSVKRRLPWLYINLGTAFLAAFVVGLFENTIARWTALAIFLPIVAGQGGNSGMQTLTVIVRDLALGELEPGGWEASLGQRNHDGAAQRRGHRYRGRVDRLVVERQSRSGPGRRSGDVVEPTCCRNVGRLDPVAAESTPA